MDDELKVLVVGCGAMSNKWLGVAEKELRIVGLVDIQRENAERRAKEYGIRNERVFEDLDAALKSTRPDMVFDCTVPEAHYEVTMKALSAGCHVLSEKPLADSMEHAKEMVDKARRTGKLYAVMQNRRYLATAPATTEFINSGVIGDITTINVDFYMGAHFKGFRTEMKHPLLLDMAIHTFDQARQLTAADPLEVYCKAFNPKNSWYAGNASAMCVFQMTNDIVFNYRGSWCSEGYITPWAGSWRIIGTRGTVLWAEGTPRAEVVDYEEDGLRCRMKERKPDKPPLKVTGHEACIKEFIECVGRGGRPQTVGEDNIKSLAMVFGAIESAEAGHPVSIV